MAPSIASLPSSEASASPAQLLVLGKKGSSQQWLLDVDGKWSSGQASTATAVTRAGQRLVFGRPDGLEVRPLTSPGLRGTFVPKIWGLGPDASPAFLAVAPNDRTAVSIEQGDAIHYLLTDTNPGKPWALAPIPSSPFDPSLAWLDDHRLATLSSDKRMWSHLGVIDIANKSMSLSNSLTGLRTFALSSDRRTLAAATESAVFAGPTSHWLAGSAPTSVFKPRDGQIVTSLALDSAGTKLSILAGTVADTGEITGIHLIVLEDAASGWHQTLDVPVPFDTATSQVWLT
jgi:hypothetical protein